MLLDVASNRVEVLGALVARKSRPLGESIVGGLDSKVNILSSAIHSLRNLLLISGGSAGKILAVLRIVPLVVHEDTELAIVVSVNPGLDSGRGLRARTIFELSEDIARFDGHLQETRKEIAVRKKRTRP
jgi:hypothetical protein